MDSGNDPIKALLETTGFTCDDLLQKLLQYKNLQNKPAEKPDEVLLKNTETAESDNHVDTTSGSLVDTTSGPLEEPEAEATAPLSIERKEQEDFLIDDSFVLENNKNEEHVVETSSHVVTENNGETTTEKISSLEVFQEESQVVSIDESKTTQSNFDSGPKSPLESDEKEEWKFQDEKTNEDEKIMDSLNETHITRRTSISDELVKKLSDRLNITQIESSEVDTNTSQTINQAQENDIEVCQLPDPPPKPLLKLRSDLFENNSKGNFTVSDNEDDDEDNDPEIKEFLKNIEVVTTEVKDTVQKSLAPKDVDDLDTSKMRKVKMGFVKKKILYKAIRSVDDVEHERNEQNQSDEILSASEKSNNENEFTINGVSEEEVRENLKLQLCSLRNRKKTEDLLKDKREINNLKKTYEKKKALEVCQISSTTINTESTSQNISLEDNPSLNRNNDPLFSLSADTDFMIVDVQGGVEFLDAQEQESVNTPPDTPSDVIKLTKTKDVTKIKGWKNKKFQLNDQIISTKEPVQDKDSQISNKETVQGNKEVVQCENTKIDNEKNVQCENTTTSNKKALQCKNIQLGDGKEQELSPFVSNTLEEFLTENSTLNISYYIPKLGAEEAINTEKYNTVLIPQTETTTSETTKKGDEANIEKTKGVKPKTLAEKRRMLESSKTKTLNMEMFNKSSFVIYNGKKIYVPTMHSEKCLEVIKFTPNVYSKIVESSDKETKENMRLTLLNEYHRSHVPVKYKPGPLSEKVRLQNQESLSEWHTEVRKLPTVKLKIIPEIGKPVPPPLIHLFNFGPIVKEDRLEFALSAVVTKKQEKKLGFTLTVPYANKQKYILARKRNKITSNVIYDIPPEKNTVESVLNDIISYVEHKENEKMIIREAEEYVDHSRPEGNKRINEANAVRKAKRRRLDIELTRLSCKVVSVSVDDNEEAESTCQQPFCRFGCLCKSLNCTPRIPVHCTKLECMFDCSCASDKNISLEGGPLSCDAVTRLEDQAKRNLARVEKEFTQTVIQTDDQTILIPSSDRNKTKRTKRIPRRFCDYMDDYNLVQKDNCVAEEEKEEEVPRCFVELKKLDLRGIIPLCLYHDCYNCTCSSNNGKRSNPSSDVEDSGQSKAKKKKISVEKKVPKEAKEKDENPPNVETQGIASSNNESDSDYMEELKITDSRRNKYKGGCARVFGVHPEVLARNEIPFYKIKIKTKVVQAEGTINFDPASLSDVDYTEPYSDEIDVTTPMEISAVDRLKLFLLGKFNRARKALRVACSDGKYAQKTFYKPVFEGEIIVPTKENKEFVRKLGVKTADPYIRLLPWKHLLVNYHKKLINIWCPTNTNRNMILNLSCNKAPSGYVEMKESRRRNGIMNWILSGKLPNNTPPHLVHLILSPKNGHFEISGICLKNISDEQKQKGCILEEKKAEVESVKQPLNAKPPTYGYPKHFIHKDHKNESNELAMLWRNFSYRKLHPVLGSAEATEKSQAIDVRLPLFAMLRFRMLFLNSNFTFLLFKKSDYSIKYTDLMQVVKMAQEKNLTIHLHCRKLTSGYTHVNFGIYAVPDYADVLFIGPYRMNEEHGLQTLRYLKQELVPTEYFDMVQGGSIPENRTDKWLWHTSYFTKYFETLRKVRIMRENIGGLKQKDQKNEYAVLTPLPSTSTGTVAETAKDFARQYYCDTSGDFITSEDLETKPFVEWQDCVILNDKRLREEDYNRYLLTNIKGFGYLGAVKHEDSAEIEVVWPISNKVLRFANVSVAVSYLKRRFTNLLMPVPASFNFQIFVHDDVESIKNLSKVDIKFLNGTHICGSFGILDSRQLTPELALLIGTTQEEVLSRLAKRAQYLGALEIQRLKEQEVSLIKKKRELMIKKQNYLKRYMELLKDLPEQERLEEYSELMQHIQGEERSQEEEEEDRIDTSTEMTCPEGADSVEIEDSDSEEPSAEAFIELSTSPNTAAKPEPNVVMTSILKPKVAPQTAAETSSDSEVSKPVKNFRLVKTATGKVVFMRDNSGVSLSTSLSGIKLKIRNNKVIDVPP